MVSRRKCPTCSRQHQRRDRYCSERCKHRTVTPNGHREDGVIPGHLADGYLELAASMETALPWEREEIRAQMRAMEQSEVLP